MRFRVQIDGYVEVDNPVGEPDWDDVSVIVDED